MQSKDGYCLMSTLKSAGSKPLGTLLSHKFICNKMCREKCGAEAGKPPYFEVLMTNSA